MQQRIRRLPPGSNVSASEYNLLVDAVAALRELMESPQRWPISASFPLEVRRHAGGLHLSLAYTDCDAVMELTSRLSGGGSARAKVLWLDGTWQEAEREEITVYDVVGTMEGDPGDKGLAKFHRQSGRWLVWQLQC
jgi:hypothetical protein